MTCSAVYAFIFEADWSTVGAIYSNMQRNLKGNRKCVWKMHLTTLRSTVLQCQNIVRE